MELKNNKSAWAALATLGVTAIAATATAIIKVNKKRKEKAEGEARRDGLTAEQKMVYNEAVSEFIRLNDRIYELRSRREALQPLIRRLALADAAPASKADETDEELKLLADDIENFLTTQVPFINASLSSICHDGTTYADYVRAPIGSLFDPKLDEEDTPAGVTDGSTVSYVLRLGYFFPESAKTSSPVKAIVQI